MVSMICGYICASIIEAQANALKKVGAEKRFNYVFIEDY